MRLWSIHPGYLDTIGIVALWRESLLAQKVLQRKTKGYRNHPQLIRFRDHLYPEKAIANFLIGIWEESNKRGYNFDRGKIGKGGKIGKIPIMRGQLEYEFMLLACKLKKRNPSRYEKLIFAKEKEIQCHPLFTVIDGHREYWEKIEPGIE